MKQRNASMNLARFSRLARIARDPQTRAYYSARAELAAWCMFRASLSNEGYLFGRYIRPAARYATRFMSEAR